MAGGVPGPIQIVGHFKVSLLRPGSRATFFFFPFLRGRRARVTFYPDGGKRDRGTRGWREKREEKRAKGGTVDAWISAGDGPPPIT